MKKYYKDKKRTSVLKLWKHTLLGGVLSAVLCVGLFSFSTYAIFTADVSGKPSVVATADYQMSLSVQGGGVSISHDGEKLRYSLPVGTYEITLSASGTSSTGFAIFQFNGKEYYSAQLAPTDSMTFTLQCDVETALEYDYQWGSHGRTENVVAEGSAVTVLLRNALS